MKTASDDSDGGGYGLRDTLYLEKACINPLQGTTTAAAAAAAAAPSAVEKRAKLTLAQLSEFILIVYRCVGVTDGVLLTTHAADGSLKRAWSFQASKKHAGIKGSWGKPIQAATSALGLLSGGLAEL